jgi:predicted RNase H-like HicB family nuclease
VFYNDKDRCYIADIPDLEYCSGCGPSPEEAVREVQIAKAAWLATAKKRGKRIPKPKYRPAS